jgi:hypothetical protein
MQRAPRVNSIGLRAMISQLGASSGPSVRVRYGPGLSSRARRRRGRGSGCSETFDVAWRMTAGVRIAALGGPDAAGAGDGTSHSDASAAPDGVRMRQDRTDADTRTIGRAVIVRLQPRAVRRGTCCARFPTVRPVTRRAMSRANNVRASHRQPCWRSSWRAPGRGPPPEAHLSARHDGFISGGEPLARHEGGLQPSLAEHAIGANAGGDCILERD